MKKLISILAALLVPLTASSVPTWPTPAVPLASITISAATLQAATTGHSYWICANGTLLDAGAVDISASTINPCFYLDSSATNQLQWSLMYGAQTGNVGGKVGVAELWPTQPPEAATIPPYVRDVASHWLVTAGLGGVLQASLPEVVSDLYRVISTGGGALDTGTLPTEDFAAVTVQYTVSVAADGAKTLSEVDRAGVSKTLVTAVSQGGGDYRMVVGTGISMGALGAPPVNTLAPIPVPPGLRWQEAGAGTSVIAAWIYGERKRPLRRPAKVAPYIQWVNPGTGGVAPVVPTAATLMYLKIWGG